MGESETNKKGLQPFLLFSQGEDGVIHYRIYKLTPKLLHVAKRTIEIILDDAFGFDEGEVSKNVQKHDNRN